MCLDVKTLNYYSFMWPLVIPGLIAVQFSDHCWVVAVVEAATIVDVVVSVSEVTKVVRARRPNYGMWTLFQIFTNYVIYYIFILTTFKFIFYWDLTDIWHYIVSGIQHNGLILLYTAKMITTIVYTTTLAWRI